jgi:hypothetical protein
MRKDRPRELDPVRWPASILGAIEALEHLGGGPAAVAG